MSARANDGFFVQLEDRGVLKLDGSDALSFLNNIVSGSVPEMLGRCGGHTALLSPQGKILFEFFLTGSEGLILIDIAGSQASALARRLQLYVLRAKVRITDVSADYTVAAWWGPAPPRIGGSHVYMDPRSGPGSVAAGGHLSSGRALLERASAGPRIDELVQGGAWHRATIAQYLEHRIACGIADGEADYPLGDTFPHEANLDRTGGVAFDKGCFIGQEVVARMQHKTVVRKRVVQVSGERALASGNPEVTIEGGAAIGRLGSVAGTRGLALLRLDRAVEALTAGRRLLADGVAITVEDSALARYREAVATRGAEGP